MPNEGGRPPPFRLVQSADLVPVTRVARDARDLPESDDPLEPVEMLASAERVSSALQ